MKSVAGALVRLPLLYGRLQITLKLGTTLMVNAFIDHIAFEEGE